MMKKVISLLLCCITLAFIGGLPNSVAAEFAPEAYGNIDDDPQYYRNHEQEEEIEDTIKVPETAVALPPGFASKGSGTTFSAQALISDGWYTDGSFRYYYSGGKPVTGWQTMDSRKYYFNAAGVLTTKFGIDVSYHQGVINDWRKVKEAGVEFAMIRIGVRGYGTAGNVVQDTQFAANIKNAKAAGIKCGVYFYTQAITVAEAVAEANFALEVLRNNNIKPEDLDYPVVYDIEDAGVGNDSRAYNLNNTQRTDFCVAFSDTIAAAGFKPMIYANKDWLTNKLQISRLSTYYIWLAHWTNVTDYKGAFMMWQYSSQGRVNGINGNIDFDVSFSFQKNGDVNNDDGINIFDIMEMRDHIFGKSTLTGDNALSADVNQDGSINIFDIMKVRDHIFGKEEIK